MAYTEAELKANGEKASLCFRPNTIGHKKCDQNIREMFK